jgi:hypothetical protein
MEEDASSLNVSLVGLYGVSAYLIFLQADPQWNASSCQPGGDQPEFADCVITEEGGGVIVLVGAYRELRRPVPVHLAVVISPTPAQFLGGYLEYYAGVSSLRLPIVAGRFGPAAVVIQQQKTTMMMPVVDPASLARQYQLALQHPWDAQAMRDARFTLQLLAGRQRLVDARAYSNENELSVMFRVTDRFLQPDTNRTSISVLFHTTSSARLPFHPDAVEIPPPGIGVRIPARHVVDGWYAVQWVGVKVPRLALPITYEVSTSTSLAPWEHAFPQPAVITGRPLHACPRIATDQASFLVVYQLPENRTAVDLARHIACVAQVAPRRVTVAGHTATVGVESFIRMHQVHQALTSTTAMDIHVRRLLQEEGGGKIQRVGLLYINDTADPPVACPIGTYFSSNGTYLPLPPHSVAGPDCYGMSCIDGYGLLGDALVPDVVSLVPFVRRRSRQSRMFVVQCRTRSSLASSMKRQYRSCAIACASKRHTLGVFPGCASLKTRICLCMCCARRAYCLAFSCSRQRAALPPSSSEATTLYTSVSSSPVPIIIIVVACGVVAA